MFQLIKDNLNEITNNKQQITNKFQKSKSGSVSDNTPKVENIFITSCVVF